MDIVEFYPIGDLACGYYLKRAEVILKKFSESSNYDDINEIIGLYNTYRYIDSNMFLNTWNEEEIELYKNTIKKFHGVIGKFLAKLVDLNIIEEYLKIDINYRKDFWDLFEKYAVYKRISENMFKQIINLNEESIYEILKHNKIVKKYGLVIRQHLLNYGSSAEILLGKYETWRSKEPIQVYLPDELTSADKELIIFNYIEKKEVNINFLEVIQNVQNNTQFSISDKTKLKAKRRAEEETRKFFDDNNGIRFKTEVSFCESQEETIKFENKENNWYFSYDKKWIRENNDFSTLLNNFIYLFYFVDNQMRVNFVSKSCEMSILERTMFIHSRHAYPDGIVFQRKSILGYIQLMAYYTELLKNGIRLEEIIEWFFKEYILNEFAISDFSIKMPSADSSYIEKCRAIFPEMESVLKQYKLYVDDGCIDKELLQISSGHLGIENVPSLVEKKYVYGVGDDFEFLKYCLSSDQCMLSHVARIKKRYENFYDLIVHEKIKVDDYEAFQLGYIERLMQNNIINLDENDFIRFVSRRQINILMDLFTNDVVSYCNYPKTFHEDFDKLLANRMIKFSKTLFTIPEQDYINFMLNKSKFNNGFDLRNRYLHGTQPVGESNEGIYEQDYMYSLLIFILYVIKINDDLCVRDILKDEN